MARLWFVVVFLAFAVLLENIEGTPYKRGQPPIQADEPNDEIVVDEMQPKSKRVSENSQHPREKRMAWPDVKWPKSGSVVNIPYTQSGVDSDVLQRAIEVFNAKTCIRFVPRGSESNYLAITSGSRCYAAIGYQASGSQSYELSSRCAGKKGKVMHELMHVLGFMHEQCRPDRNKYITINTGNIMSGAEGNFNIQGEYVDQSIQYDCDSILHYKATAFSTNGQPTITSSHCSALGNGDTRLSLLDYKRINTLYSCDNPTYVYFTVRVQTDSSWTSGTDCFIYIKLQGSTRTSAEFELDLDNAGSSNLFESGSDDTFSKMAFRNDLGSITGISIRMVSKGSGAGWWPTSFIVTDPVNSATHTFTNNQWLYPSDTYGTSKFTKA